MSIREKCSPSINLITIFLLLMQIIQTFSNSCDVISRGEWKAEKGNKVEEQTLPLHAVVIQHTASKPCLDLDHCKHYVRLIQKYHTESLHYDDIVHSFLVGGDGNVYEGRGWNNIGAHTRGYNEIALGITFIGNFMYELPSNESISALKKFLQCGVEKGYLSPEYRLVAHRQLSPTLSPGDRLYNEMKNWKHYVDYLQW